MKTPLSAAAPMPVSNNRIEGIDAISAQDLQLLQSRAGLRKLLRARKIDIDEILDQLRYEAELEALQVELVKLQRSVQEQERRVVVIFEGRDAAGKGGAILRFTQHLSPRAMRVVALTKPTVLEQGQWYFQRYTNELPVPGQIVFFDRSWYNRAVVEPVNGFCTPAQYETFMRQVPDFEHMLYEDGIEIIKFWFSISKKTQRKRFLARRKDPLKNWKVSPVDERAQELWDSYTHYKDLMLSRTHTSFSPWVIVETNDKRRARLESIRYVLAALPYEAKLDAKIDLYPDPNVVSRYHREAD
jgi:polyphosphate kinase